MQCPLRRDLVPEYLGRAQLFQVPLYLVAAAESSAVVGPQQKPGDSTSSPTWSSPVCREPCPTCGRRTISSFSCRLFILTIYSAPSTALKNFCSFLNFHHTAFCTQATTASSTVPSSIIGSSNIASVSSHLQQQYALITIRSLLHRLGFFLPRPLLSSRGSFIRGLPL